MSDGHDFVLSPPYWVWVTFIVLCGIGSVLLWGEIYQSIGVSPDWTVGWIIGGLVMLQALVLVTLAQLGILRPSASMNRT